MELLELSKEQWQGRPFSLAYKTAGYYDVQIHENTFKLVYQPFEVQREISFQDSFFGEWLENPIAFGIFENGQLLGYVEGTHETWNNRFRISNICIFEEANRSTGLGSVLMRKILQTARESGARMAVLETQTCNEKAIAFYRKHGFQIIGFDLYAYTNQDLERHEVRLEMGLMLEK